LQEFQISFCSNLAQSQNIQNYSKEDTGIPKGFEHIPLNIDVSKTVSHYELEQYEKHEKQLRKQKNAETITQIKSERKKDTTPKLLPKHKISPKAQQIEKGTPAHIESTHPHTTSKKHQISPHHNQKHKDMIQDPFLYEHKPHMTSSTTPLLQIQKSSDYQSNRNITQQTHQDITCQSHSSYHPKSPTYYQQYQSG
jgi:hypothetical protein